MVRDKKKNKTVIHGDSIETEKVERGDSCTVVARLIIYVYSKKKKK